MPGLGGRWRWGVNSLIFSGGSLNCDPFQLYLGNIFFMMYIPWGIIWLLLHVGVSNKTKESSMTWVLVTGRQRSRGGGLKSWLPTKSFLLSSFRDVHLPGLSPWKDHVSLEPNHGPPAPPSQEMGPSSGKWISPSSLSQLVIQSTPEPFLTLTWRQDCQCLPRVSFPWMTSATRM